MNLEGRSRDGIAHAFLPPKALKMMRAVERPERGIRLANAC